MTHVDPSSQKKVPGKYPRQRRYYKSRGAHRGVVLIKPDAGHPLWRAKWTDPDTEQAVRFTLDAHNGRTRDHARAWAITKAREIEARKRALEGGAPRLTGEPISDAITFYFAEQGSELRESTRKIYEGAAEEFKAWADKARISTTNDLDSEALARFRKHAKSAPKRVPVAGGARNEFQDSGKRKPSSIDQDLRSIKTILRFLAWRKRLPRLTRDDISAALKRPRMEKRRPTLLRQPECKALLHAAIAHDSATFKITRAEHSGNTAPGNTPRYTPIAPFISLALLTGMRRTELLTLRWACVDLHAAEIRLDAADTKTNEDRTVDLVVSPAAAELLAALNERKSGPYVFGGEKPRSRASIENPRRRLCAPTSKPGTGKRGDKGGRHGFGGPDFDWHDLRRTCGSFLVCATGTPFGGSLVRVAAQLGHSPTLAERLYWRAVKVSPSAGTLEAAMQIEREIQAVIGAVRGR